MRKKRRPKNDPMMREYMIFPLVDRTVSQDRLTSNKDDDTIELIGMIVVHNSVARGFNDNWANIIKVIANDISVNITNSDRIFSERSVQEKLIRHEIRAYANLIVRSTEKLNRDFYWLRTETNKLIKSELDLSNTADWRLTLDRIRSSISNLNTNVAPGLKEQLKFLKGVPLLQRLGIRIDEASPTIDLMRIIRDIAYLLRVEANDKGMIIQLPRIRSFRVVVFEQALIHIFENLMSNAVKHGLDNSVIEIGIEGDSKIYVQNDAPIPIGKAIQHETTLKSPGMQGQTKSGSTNNNATEGEGMGLFIVGVLSTTLLDTDLIYHRFDQRERGDKEIETHRLEVDFSKMRAR